MGESSDVDMKNLPDIYTLYENELKNQIAVNGYTESIFPITAIDDANNGPIVFEIKGTTDFIDFQKTYLKLTLQLTGGVPGDVIKNVGDSGVKVGPVNLLPHSIFSAVEISVNNVNVSYGDQNYAYRAYLDTLLDNTKNSLKTIGSLSGWVKDDPDDMNNVDSEKANSALIKRLSRKNNEHKIPYIINLHSPLFKLEKMFLPGCNVKISLQKNPEPKFYLMHQDTGSFKIQIVEAVFKVRRVATNPDYYSSILKMMELQNTPVQYTLNCPRIITVNLLAGEKFYHRDDITFGHLPRRIIVGFVETEAYSGKQNKNPFNFEHCNIKRIGLYKNGLEYPYPAIISDFSTKDYSEAYKLLISSVDGEFTPFVPDITEYDYAHGFTLFSWELSPDQRGDTDTENIRNKAANIRLSVEFANSLSKNMTMIIYILSEMKLTIDKTKQVVVETNI